MQEDPAAQEAGPQASGSLWVLQARLPGSVAVRPSPVAGEPLTHLRVPQIQETECSLGCPWGDHPPGERLCPQSPPLRGPFQPRGHCPGTACTQKGPPSKWPTRGYQSGTETAHLVSNQPRP